jgi:hypothetical protein
MSTFSDLEQRILDVKAKLPSALKTEARKSMYEVAAIMSSQYMREGEGNNEQSVTGPSRSDKLGVGSGALYKSFLPGNENNELSIEVTDDTVTIESKSKLKYAMVHEKGMFIASKGRMEKFFWGKFYSTGNPYMRAMALSVRKRGGVNIQARPFIAPSIKDWQAQKSSAMLGRIVKVIEQTL